MKCATSIAVVIQLVLAGVLFAVGFPGGGALLLVGAAIWATTRRAGPPIRDYDTQLRRQAAVWALVGLGFAAAGVLAALDVLAATPWFPYLAPLATIAAWSLAARMWRHTL